MKVLHTEEEANIAELENHIKHGARWELHHGKDQEFMADIVGEAYLTLAESGKYDEQSAFKAGRTAARHWLAERKQDAESLVYLSDNYGNENGESVSKLGNLPEPSTDYSLSRLDVMKMIAQPTLESFKESNPEDYQWLLSYMENKYQGKSFTKSERDKAQYLKAKLRDRLRP